MDYCYYNQNNEIEFIFDQNMIRDQFEDFIEDDQMLKLKIPIVEKIFEIKYDGYDSKDKRGNKNVIDFLFKYLLIHGRESSKLFLFAKYETNKEEYLPHLMNEEKYKTLIDLKYVNEEIVEENINFKNIIKEQKDEITNLDEENELLKQEIFKL